MQLRNPKSYNPFVRWRAALVALAGGLLLTACNRHVQAPPGPAPEVAVVTVQPSSVPVTTELSGRVSAVRVAEVRARVAGILLKRNFKEGTEVRAGDVLFEIDPAPLQAARDSASAAVTKAEASLKDADVKTARFKTLVEVNAVSKQDYDTAVATSSQAEADVLSAKAALETASLNLGYTKVVAPISGRIGTAKVTEGALVGQNETTLLAVIQQLDPIYVDLTESSAELFKLKDELASGHMQSESVDAKASLLLDNGRKYREQGTMQSSEVTVDASTGSVGRRALFPNPNRDLLPGMFVRARIEEGVRPNAFLVPQIAVSRDSQGGATVMLAGAGNKVEPRVIVTEGAVGDQWLVSTGIAIGDRVIVKGLQWVRPGMEVKPVPANAAPAPAVALSTAH
ncbi:MAG TPA: efflux RND transporter periplasmic adaptor subunit [Verrucomicrobiae bacterium]|nr:efflux RND transporter periplasmic adaptor subunit [Verrucomicrobiae bacterium]